MDPKEELFHELSQIPWFQDQKPELIQDIANMSKLRPFKNGDIFFHEGDKQDYFYFVLSGRVALDIFIPHHGKVRVDTCEEGESFGWSSVTTFIGTRTAGAVGVLEGTVLAINVQKLLELCDKDHDFGYIFMRNMSSVIASRLLVTRLQLLDMFAEPTENKNVD